MRKCSKDGYWSVAGPRQRGVIRSLLIMDRCGVVSQSRQEPRDRISFIIAQTNGAVAWNGPNSLKARCSGLPVH